MRPTSKPTQPPLDLRQQLRAWQQESAASERPASPATGTSALPGARAAPVRPAATRPSSGSRIATSAAPASGTSVAGLAAEERPLALDAEELRSDAPSPLTDAQLFLQALEELPVGADAILQKYQRDGSRSQGGTGEAPAPRADISDRALFLQAVGDFHARDVERSKPTGGQRAREAEARFARRVARGDIQPHAAIDLHGDDRSRAAERLRTFLAASARARHEVLLVVHGKGLGILAGEVADILESSAHVAEHVAAPAELGGQGARLVRLHAGGARGQKNARRREGSEGLLVEP